MGPNIFVYVGLLQGRGAPLCDFKRPERLDPKPKLRGESVWTYAEVSTRIKSVTFYEILLRSALYTCPPEIKPRVRNPSLGAELKTTLHRHIHSEKVETRCQKGRCRRCGQTHPKNSLNLLYLHYINRVKDHVSVCNQVISKRS